MEIEDTKQVMESTKLSAIRGRKPKTTKSGDKLLCAYVKNKNLTEQTKKKYTSKLPRFVKNSSFYRSNKNICKQIGKDNAGDNTVGSRTNRIQKPKNYDPCKQKPSGIPLRQNTKEEPMTENVKKPSEQVFEVKNIQRVQMLINADLCPEDRTQTSSVVSAKPIPTLGQIYRESNIIGSDRFRDWFMSLNTPLNSFESNPAIQIRPSIDNEERRVIDVEIDTSCDESTIVLDRINLIQQIYKTTSENANEWITSEMECLGVENESGYRSSSPENLRRATDINFKQTDTPAIKSTQENNWINVNKKASNRFSNETNEGDIKEKEESITDGSTINEVNTELNVIKYQLSKDKLFEHDEYAIKAKERNEQDRDGRKENIPYVQCPSEIFQKTTNFEGCDSLKTVSSIMATEGELRDELSSQCTLEQIDDCSVLEVHSADDWVSQCKSHEIENLVKKTSNEKETTSKYLRQHSWNTDENNSRQYYHNSNCWKKRLLRQKYHAKCNKKDRCKKCQRFSGYPSIRYKITNRLASFRKQLWIRICRKRWNHVWKKTAERWAQWSKSPSKLKNVRMMHYLQREIIWEDAKVQTTVLVYRETGTDTVLREQKSAAISALLKLESSKCYGVPHPSTSMGKKSRVNSGPSMFPFLEKTREETCFLEKKKDSFEIVLQHTNIPQKITMSYNSCYKEEMTDANNDDKIAKNASMTSNKIINDVRTTLNHIQLQMPALLEAGTQICMIHTNAETDAIARCANSVATVTSYHVPFHRPSFTNTETKYVQVDNNDAGSQNNVKKSYDIETQAVPTRPIKISRAITTTLLGNEPSVAPGVSPFVGDVRKKHFSVQAVPLTTTFTHTKPKLLSISSAIIKTTSAAVSKQEVISAGVSTNDVNIIESCHGLTTPNTKPCCKNEMKPSDQLKSNSYIVSHNTQSCKWNEYADIFTNTVTFPKSISATKNDTITPVKPVLPVNSSSVINNEILVDNKTVVIDTATDKEEINPRFLMETTALTNESLVTKKSSTATYTKIDKQTYSKITNQAWSVDNIKKLAKEKEYFSTTVNAHNKADVRLNDSLGLGAEPSTIADRVGFSTTYTHVEIEAHPILIEKATDFDNNKSPVKEKLVSTSAHANIEDTIGTIIDQSLANKKPLVKERSVCTNFFINSEIQAKLISQDQATIVPSKKSLTEKKSATTSTVNNFEKQTSPEPINQSICATSNKSLEYFTDFGNQIQPEYKEQATSISTCKKFEEETFTTPVDYKHLSTINRCFKKSNTKVHAQTSSDIKQGLIRTCACAAPNYDRGTSTRIPNSEYATQTTSTHQRKTEITISACNRICSKTSKLRIHDPLRDKITSLSRLIGQRDPNIENDFHRRPSSMPTSALNANNWIKTCTYLQRGEHACQSIDNYEKSVLEDLKQFSAEKIASTSPNSNKMICNCNPVKRNDFVISTLPALTLSKDSMADILHNQKLLKRIPSTEIPQKRAIMVDQATSDEVNVKNVKEFTLQVCPEISNKDCVFVYREPRVVYNQQIDAGVQRKPSNKDVEVEPIGVKHQTHVSVGSSAPSGKKSRYCHKKNSDIAGEVLSPRVYKALYETTKFVFKEDLSQTQPLKYLNQQPSFRNAAVNSHPLDTDFKFTMVQNREVRSATVMTTRCKSLQKSPCVDQSTQSENSKTVDRDINVNTQTLSACRVSLTDVTAEKDCSEDCVKTHLAASCRYYSKLLTKQIGRVKENLTRHLAPPTDAAYRYDARVPNVEACTMKPSARQELGCQTIKLCRYCNMKKPTCYNILSPTSSLTDICRYDREHLKSVYYILSAIEGRIRRLKAHVPT